jgi:hypothetical protein
VRVTPRRANSERAAASICCFVCSDSSFVLRTLRGSAVLPPPGLDSRAAKFTYNLDCI